MHTFLKHRLIALWLLVTFVMLLQSCEEEGTQPVKQKVQFSFSTNAQATGGRMKDLPENSNLRISIESPDGTEVLTNHEIPLLKAGNSYIAEAVELLPGGYVLTDFMIVNEDQLLYATPKAGSPLSGFVAHAVPHNFTVSANANTNVNMQVIDGREYSPEELGYASFSANIVNLLSLTAFKNEGGQQAMTAATAELRQKKRLIKTFTMDATVNTISFNGEPDAEYTLTVYTRQEAKVMTFNFQELKESLGTKPLKVLLEPALILTLEGHTEERYEWEDDFELMLTGTSGSVNVWWGDGNSDSGTLPYEGGNEFTRGMYTTVVTGDIENITDFWGFAYETYIYEINGLRNLSALKNYNPTWGAVSLHIDLSGCESLESIFIEKWGSAPNQPIDLRTDFKLPATHSINDFVFYVPGIEETRGKVTAEELRLMVANIYNNTTSKQIYDGRFIVTPVATPLPETQWMLDELQYSYNWQVALNSDDIYNDFPAEDGRSKASAALGKENWLKHRKASSMKR